MSLDVEEGETLGLVGESGCGKSTTGRSILQLVRPDSGSVRYAGRELVGLSAKEMRPLRRELAMVFQDPFGSLDPRLPVSELIAEPLRIHDVHPDEGARAPASRSSSGWSGSRPSTATGTPTSSPAGSASGSGSPGPSRLDPRLIVLDEPVSALDVSIQAGVVNLLEDLQERLGLSYLFIAHDLSVVRHISDRVAVMYLGKVVEIGDAGAVYRPAPLHPGAALGRPAAGPGRERRRASPGGALRRHPEPGEPAVGLPLPHPVLQGPGHLRDPGTGVPGAGGPVPPDGLSLQRPHSRGAGAAVRTCHPGGIER